VTKKAYIDERKLCQQFTIGDIVLLPIFTRGNRYAPSMGRVTAVLDKIGFLDVETSFGTLRLSPTEVTKRDIEDTDLEDTGDNTWERERAQRVASSFYHKRYSNLVSKANRLREEGLQEMDAYNFLFSRFASTHSDDEIQRSIRVAFIESRVKNSLYWKAKGRQYGPTQSEVETSCFHCPQCKTELQKACYQKRTKLYVCPQCLWMITPADLLNPGEEPEPLDQQRTVVDFFTPKDPLLQAVYGDRESSIFKKADEDRIEELEDTPEDLGAGPLPVVEDDDVPKQKVVRTPGYFDTTTNNVLERFYRGTYRNNE